MPHPTPPVLVATDLSDESDAIARVGLDVARGLAAPVHLVNAGTPPAYAFMGDAYASEAATLEILEAYEARQREALAAQVARLGLEGDALDGSTAAAGPAHQAVRAVAAERGAQLIVLGASRDGLARLLGSTADRVARAATCPVLVVRGALAVPPRRVLFALDLSGPGSAALGAGLDLVGRLAGSETEGRALFALEPLQHDAAPQFRPEQIERLADEELERAAGGAVLGGRPIERRVVLGEARAAIVDEARRWPADLLVVGTHGRSGFDRLLLGSVAAGVLRDAPCSVLVCPSEGAPR